MESKYDGMREQDLLDEGYRITKTYATTKLYKRNDTYIVANINLEGNLEVLLQLKTTTAIPRIKVRKKKRWWRR